MKQLSAAKHPVTRCTPFKFWIGLMLVIAEIFSGLASMPRSETIKPSSPPWNSKDAFLGVELDIFGSQAFECFIKIGN
jgi:hypothetical protein